MLRRLFSSTQQQQQLPHAVTQLLHNAPLEVEKVAGAGRGLVAARDLQHGEVLFCEQPYLCIPAHSQRSHVCYHCLRVLGGLSSQAEPVRTRRHVFCSAECVAAAHASYYMLEQRVDLSPLERYCEQHSERFPLLAARLALMVCQRAITQPRPETAAAAAAAAPSSKGLLARTSRGLRTLATRSHLSSSSSQHSSGQSRRTGIARASAPVSLGHSLSGIGTHARAGGAQEGDPSAPLSFLCFANVPPPPPAPWQDAHALLVRALAQAACSVEEEGDTQGAAAQAEALAAALDRLDIDWYVAVLARLHLNTFKVQGVLPLAFSSADAGAAALAAAASAMLSADDASTGSALYLLASLFNHSCEPCINVMHPSNDATAVFTAARDVKAGEQLFIAYSDCDADVGIRQEWLAFSYGFRCQCAKCAEELADAAKHAPPQL